MGFTECSKYLRFAFVLLIASEIFLVFGFALPYWYEYEFTIGNSTDTVKVEYGIWQYCNVTIITTKCETLTGDMAPGWMKLSRGMLMLSVVLVLVDVITISIVLFKKNDSKIIRMVAIVVCFVTCVLLFSGITLYASKQNKEGGKLSGSFGITVVSLVFAIGGAILVILDRFSFKT